MVKEHRYVFDVEDITKLIYTWGMSRRMLNLG